MPILNTLTTAYLEANFLNYLTFYSLSISFLLIYIDRKNIRASASILFFIGCLMAYVLIENISNIYLQRFLLAGPFLLPMSFWIFSKSLFNDYPISVKKYFSLSIIVLTAYYLLYFLGITNRFALVIGKILSLVFVILAIVESQKGKAGDLDFTRIRWRKYFIYIIGSVALITLVVELGLPKHNQSFLQHIQRLAILLINSLFILLNYKHHSHLLSKPAKKIEIINPELVEIIQNTMINEQLYRQEKLTIGDLALKLNVQEYKLRQTINQEMGYRNFLDFVNSYRIKAATDILKDPAQKDFTMQEICYNVGFNSLAPFNKAFKIITETTPSAYRKKFLG